MTRQSGRSGDAAPILRMFEKVAPRLIDVVAIRALFDKFAVQTAGTLCDIAPVEMSSRLERLDQGLATQFLVADSRSVIVIGNVIEWRTTAFVRLDQGLLFQLLDTMYGGDPRRRAAAPARPLTALEGALAVEIACSVMGTLRQTLSGLASFTFLGARIFDPTAATEAPAAGTSVLATASIVESGEEISVVVPIVGLELVREKTDVRDEAKVEAGVDPEWAAGFKKNLMATTVALSAVVEGPAMTISDIANLQPGAVVELEAEALKRVRIESDSKAIFTGALGQARGVFTVLLEDVVLAARGGRP